MKLEEKQEAFEYRSPKDLYVHQPPCSPDEWNKRLAKIGGRDPVGDQRLQIVWGGTAKKRAYAQTDTGSIEVMSIKYPGPFPKIRESKGFTYKNAQGKTVYVTRLDMIPKGSKDIQPQFEYFELGQLRWMLERKFTPEELIAMGNYPDPRSPQARTFGVRGGRRYIAPMDPRGEYVALYPLQTKDGKYLEPDELWFESLKKTIHEIEHASDQDKKDMLAKTFDEIEEAERKAGIAREEYEEALFEDTLIEVQKAPKGVVIFT